MSIQEINNINNNIEYYFYDNMVNIVLFFSDNCSPCKSIKQFLNNYISQNYEKLNSVKFHFIEINKNKNVLQNYNIQGVPKFLFFIKKNNKIFLSENSISGNNPDKLINAIDNSIIKLNSI